MTLSDPQRDAYRRTGHVTVPGVFAPAACDAAIADIAAWGESVKAGLATPAQRAWYLEAGVAGEVLRKLDHPAFHRPALRALGTDKALVALVEDLIGPGVTICFSQVFMKPPHGGGPKPLHQDNAYFGPRDPDRAVTAWVALDDSAPDNGCLLFGDGTHRAPLLPHAAPPAEPFNLQVPADVAAAIALTPAPVPKGGVSFHHGAVVHGSGENRSVRWRRACAFHYVANDNPFVTPALPYDSRLAIRVS